ncbi:MAG: hypothetical protein FWF97_03605 [Alphaproteobacteria bacterium]|nr:hypothetical protein [Alphaproteobacteria bacterium]
MSEKNNKLNWGGIVAIVTLVGGVVTAIIFGGKISNALSTARNADATANGLKQQVDLNTSNIAINASNIAYLDSVTTADKATVWATIDTLKANNRSLQSQIKANNAKNLAALNELGTKVTALSTVKTDTTDYQVVILKLSDGLLTLEENTDSRLKKLEATGSGNGDDGKKDEENEALDNLVKKVKDLENMHTTNKKGQIIHTK